MVNPTGNLTLNGITDAELVKILEAKMKHEHSLIFNPQQMQPANVAIPNQFVNPPNQPNVRAQKMAQVYNNVTLQWANEEGLKAIQEIVQFLLKKEEAAQSAAQ